MYHRRSWLILKGQVRLLREAELKLKDELDLMRRKCSMRTVKNMFKQKEQRLQRPWAGRWDMVGNDRESRAKAHIHSSCARSLWLKSGLAAYSSRPHLDLSTTLHSYPTSPSFHLRSYPSSFNTCFSVGLLETNRSMSFPKMSLFHRFVVFYGNTFFPQQLY